MPATPTRSQIAFGYVRVSTAEQTTSGLGLDAQKAAISAASKERGWELRAIHEDAGVSSVARTRPGLDAAEAACAATPGAVLVVARLDRLARSLIAYAALLDRAQRQDWRLLAVDAPDTDTAAGEAMQGVVAIFAQLERRLISERTRDALAAARARGVQLGRPVDVPEDVQSQILALRRRRWTATRIAAQLQAQGVPSPRGDRWHTATVTRIVARAGGRFKRGRPARRRSTRQL
jgi:DNA invertase Pin-like site-specific DNA recombinase